MIKNFLLLLTALFLTYSTYCFSDELIIEPDNGRQPILNAIAQAHSSIDLALYGLTDTHFTRALAQAKNKGKSVHILLESQPYKMINENKQTIQFLHNTEIPVHLPSAQFKFLHQKTFLFDNHTALVMTFNLTNSSFRNQRNFALLITDPAMVQEMQRVFDADWNHRTVTVSNPNLVWSPDNSRRKILQFIQQAHSDIKIDMQTITDYEIIGALANAARAKINVQILLSELPAKKYLRYLTHAGVAVRLSTHYIIHAKMIVVDQKKAMLGSINLTKTSLDQNRELSVITENKQIVYSLATLFDQDSIFSRKVFR